MQHYLDQVPDGVKVVASVSTPVLSILGFPVEQWGYVLSAIVAILFIIEKLPMLIQRIESLVKWIKRVKQKE